MVGEGGDGFQDGMMVNLSIDREKGIIRINPLIVMTAVVLLEIDEGNDL